MSERQESRRLGGPDFLSVETSQGKNLGDYDECQEGTVHRSKLERDLETTLQDENSSTVYTPNDNAMVFDRDGATIFSIEEYDRGSDEFSYRCAKLDENTDPSSDEVTKRISDQVVEVVEEHLS